MAIFNPTQTKLISKLTVGSEVYYLKDYEARELLAQLGEAAKKDVAAGVSAEDHGLVTGAQVQAAIAGLSGAMHFRGVVNALPESVAGYESGDVILVGSKEYVCDGTKWVELGDESIYALKTVTIGKQSLAANIDLNVLAEDMGLGALAYKSSATGDVAGQTITGVKATGTSTGSIDVALTQTATAATLAKSDYTPEGTISGSTTASGTVSIAPDAKNGTQISGSVSAPTVTVRTNTDSIKKVISVGELPTKAKDTFSTGTLPSFTQGAKAQWSASVDNNETLSFSFTANGDDAFSTGTLPSYTEGAFTQGALPELAAESTTFVTGIASAEASAPVFTGDKFAATFSGAESVVSATFTGTTTKVVSGVTYDKATVNADATKFNPAAIELAVGDITVAKKSVTVQ